LDNTGLPGVLTAKEMLLTANNEFIILCDNNNNNNNNNATLLKAVVSSQDRITAQLPTSLTFNLSPLRFTQTQNNDLLITGITNGKVGLIRVNSQGTNVWNTVQEFGNQSLNNTGHQVIENADGSILTVGTIDFFDKKMIGVIKTTAAGKLE
jgi:hypothetical protein